MLFIQSKASLSELTKQTLFKAASKMSIAVVCIGDGTYTSASLLSFLPKSSVFVVQADAAIRGVKNTHQVSFITAAEYADLFKRYPHGIPLV